MNKKELSEAREHLVTAVSCLDLLLGDTPDNENLLDGVLQETDIACEILEREWINFLPDLVGSKRMN